MKTSKIEVILNKSLTYFLPIVDAQIDFQHLHLMRNCYLQNGEDEDFCVLYEWNSNQQFTKWEKELMENHLYVGHEDYDGLTLYKFRLSKNMKEARTLFINGKYSMFTTEHKTAIDNFLKKRGASNRAKIMRILRRDESLRLEMNAKFAVQIDPNNELSSKPDLFQEDFSNFCTKIEFKIEQFLNEDEDGEEKNS